MKDLWFRRSPNWSAAYAASRIEEVLRRCHARIAAIEAKKAELDVEAANLTVFQDHLDALLRVEVSARDRRAAKKPGGPDRLAPPAIAQADGQPAALADFSSAITHTGKRGYHRGGKFFMPKGWASSGSTEPKRYDVSTTQSDLDLLRLVKMIEVPGLIHAMIMAEKAQEVIDVDAVVVPERALGINLSDAYSEHVFSLEAYKTLIDPLKADGYIDELEAGFMPPEDS